MKQIILALCAAILVSSAALTAQNKYLGVKKCAMCHKNEKMGGVAYTAWEKTSHAKALDALKSKEADEIAKKAGSAKPAVETPECLSCHVTGTNVKEEGVSCEGCHGAAEKYFNVHNKKDADAKTKAVAAGMIVGDEAKKTCETCHNKKSPTFKSFDYAKSWEKIKHGGKKG